jgi:hypothetical protein
MDLSNANAALWSHVSSSVVDSRDWRFRVWDWRIFVRGATAGAAFAWRETTAPSLVPQAMTGGLAARAVGFGMGQSFVPDGAQISAGAAVVLAVDPTSLAELGAASRISLYVDHQDGGKLKFSAIGAPNVLAFIWLTASAPYPNV